MGNRTYGCDEPGSEAPDGKGADGKGADGKGAAGKGPAGHRSDGIRPDQNGAPDQERSNTTVVRLAGTSRSGGEAKASLRCESEKQEPPLSADERALIDKIGQRVAARGLSERAFLSVLGLLQLHLGSPGEIARAETRSAMLAPAEPAAAPGAIASDIPSYAKDSITRLGLLVDCIETAIGSLDDTANAYALAQLLVISQGHRQAHALLDD